jgi:hypothetical protein
MDLPLGVIIGGACALGALVVFAVLIVVALHWSKRNTAAWRTVGERTGLQFTQKTFPELQGRLDGSEVHADVFTMQAGITAPGRSRSRGYTRVRAKLPREGAAQVLARAQTYGGTRQWPARSTGDAAFDARYEVLAPPEADLNSVVPAAARAALLAAPVPVHITGGSVLFSQVRVLRDAARLEQALRTCAAVAAAFR